MGGNVLGYVVWCMVFLWKFNIVAGWWGIFSILSTHCLSCFFLFLYNNQKQHSFVAFFYSGQSLVLLRAIIEIWIQCFSFCSFYPCTMHTYYACTCTQTRAYTPHMYTHTHTSCSCGRKSKHGMNLLWCKNWIWVSDTMWLGISIIMPLWK